MRSLIHKQRKKKRQNFSHFPPLHGTVCAVTTSCFGCFLAGVASQRDFILERNSWNVGPGLVEAFWWLHREIWLKEASPSDEERFIPMFQTGHTHTPCWFCVLFCLCVCWCVCEHEVSAVCWFHSDGFRTTNRSSHQVCGAQGRCLRTDRQHFTKTKDTCWDYDFCIYSSFSELYLFNRFI